MARQKNYTKQSFTDPDNTTDVCNSVRGEKETRQCGSHKSVTFKPGCVTATGKVINQELHLTYPNHHTGIGLAIKIFAFFTASGMIVFLIANQATIQSALLAYAAK